MTDNKIKSENVGVFAFIKSNLLACAISLVIIIAAIVVLALYCFDNSVNPNEIGDWLAGFASLITFTWLIASYRLQARELLYTRDELKENRVALVDQKKQLEKSAKSQSEHNELYKNSIFVANQSNALKYYEVLFNQITFASVELYKAFDEVSSLNFFTTHKFKDLLLEFSQGSKLVFLNALDKELKKMTENKDLGSHTDTEFYARNINIKNTSKNFFHLSDQISTTSLNHMPELQKTLVFNNIELIKSHLLGLNQVLKLGVK